MRKLKTYESFKEPFKFEEQIIDPILGLIRDNQEFLTQTENLPQLAKLGYMYNTLWYSGRVCWDTDGILLDKKLKIKFKSGKASDSDWQFASCGENPKYKIEMCNPQNDDIENLVYDAWSMHVSNGIDSISSKEFINLIKNGKPLSEFDKKQLKINKTLDEWVEILTDIQYQYHRSYPNRKSVVDYLLCTIGTGYGWNKDGFIIKQAGGADRDKALYGDWQNAKFSGEIKSVVDKILSIPELSETLDASEEHIRDIKRKEEEKRKSEDNKMKSLAKMIKGKVGDSSGEMSDEELDEIINSLYKSMSDPDANKVVSTYRKYYPISSSSSIFSILDKEKQTRLGIIKFDQSYIDGSIEICQDIMRHEKEESKENVEFAIKLLAKFGFEEYKAIVPKEVDKYAILEEVENSFLYITDNLYRQSVPNNWNLKKGEYNLTLNDTKNSDYADNSYTFCMSLDGYTAPKGYDIGIESLKSTPIYSDLVTSLYRLRQISDIKVVTIYCDCLGGQYDPMRLTIKMVSNPKYVKYEEEIQDEDSLLKKEGFQVGSTYIALELDKYILRCSKPKPLGDGHPMNTGRSYFSTNGPIQVLDKNWNKLSEINLDERGLNTLQTSGSHNKEIREWVNSEFLDMKKSDPGYGTYGISGIEYINQGKKNLYRHHFMLWLKDHQR